MKLGGDSKLFPWAPWVGVVVVLLVLALVGPAHSRCSLDSAVKGSPVPLSLSPPLKEHSQTLTIPEDIRREMESIRYRQPVGYRGFLTYAPTDGFSNQLVSFSVAMVFAWLTNRVLVVPPILGHFEGPARANCFKPEIKGLGSQGEIRGAYSKLLAQKINDGSYQPLSSILNLTLFEDYVAMIDSRELYSQPWASTLSTYEVPYDCCTCPDTVWISYPLTPAQSPKTRDEKFTFRSVEKTLGTRPEDVISMGTVYFPSLYRASSLFRWPVKCIYRRFYELIENPPFVDKIMNFGKQVQKLRGWFACAHIRVADSYFKASQAATLRSLMKGLLSLKTKANNPWSKPSLLIISDTPLAELPPQFVAALRARFELFTLAESYSELMQEVNKSLGRPLDLMHFEASACTYASAFVGNPVSTFSRRIMALRDARQQ